MEASHISICLHFYSKLTCWKGIQNKAKLSWNRIPRCIPQTFMTMINYPNIQQIFALNTAPSLLKNNHKRYISLSITFVFSKKDAAYQNYASSTYVHCIQDRSSQKYYPHTVWKKKILSVPEIFIQCLGERFWIFSREATSTTGDTLLGEVELDVLPAEYTCWLIHAGKQYFFLHFCPNRLTAGLQ